MEFTRKKYIRNPKVYKEWYDDSEHYRINWRSEIEGIPIRPTFYACVKCERFDGQTMWDFAGKRGPYKTLRKAIEAANLHRKVWDKWFQIMAGPYKGRAAKLDELREGLARVGGENTTNNILHSMPLWVLRKANAKEVKLLRSDDLCKQTDEDESDLQSDPTPTLKTSAPTIAASQSGKDISSKTRKRGRASSASAMDTSGSATTVAEPQTVSASRSKRAVKPVKGRAKGKRKSANVNTTKKSKRGKKSASALAT